jgi:hypothetical protein
MTYDLNIYFSGNSYVSGMCSQWDVQNYNVTCEIWLKKGSFKALNDNIRPGAVTELYNILGKPKYMDTTWQGFNTIRLSPVNGTKLYEMRDEKIVYPKSISSTPIAGASGWISVKIDALTSSNSL